MTVTIIGTPKEIAALVDELQERRDRSGAAYAEAVTSDRIAAYGPTDDKLGDPAANGNKIEQYLRSKDLTSADPGLNTGELQAP